MRNEDEKYEASAVVDITIRVPCSSRWGHDATVAQIEKQATEEAIGTLKTALCLDDGSGLVHHKGKNGPYVKLMKDPKVTQVLVEKMR
jgi:hypothetical protein